MSRRGEFSDVVDRYELAREFDINLYHAQARRRRLHLSPKVGGGPYDKELSPRDLFGSK